jgi:hypothetical protein
MRNAIIVVMLKKLFALFIVFVFSISSFSEVLESSHADEHITETIEHIDINQNLLVEDKQCSDCQDHDCNNNNCRLNFCSCPSTLFFKSNRTHPNLKDYVRNNLNWHFFQKYKSPSLDSALKPPLFS